MARPSLASVIVPARDSERTLPAMLEGLAAQDYDGAWEVIVVDNGSGDGTREVARRGLERLPDGRLLEAERRGAGPARNVGAARARGDLLVFCDADDVPEPGWLSALARAAASADLVAGAVRIDALNERMPPGTFTIPPTDRASVAYGFLPFAYGGNCAVSSRVFHAIGGVDESFRFGQDVDMCWRVQLAGHRLAFASDAAVQRRLRTRNRGRVLQHFRMGMVAAHLYSRYRRRGMPGSPWRSTLANWVGLVAGIPVAVLVPDARAEWLRRVGIRTGRLAGSARYRTLYL